MTMNLTRLTAHIILLLLLAVGTPNVRAQIPAGSSSRSTQSDRTGNYDTHPFDPSLERLPANYHGINPVALYTKLMARRKSALKDEFETTEQFRLRIQKEASAPLLGTVTVDSIIAFEAEEIQARYDADQELMNVAVNPSRDFNNIQFVNRDVGTFIERIKMDIPTAKSVKPNLRALAVTRLQTPYIAERSYYDYVITAELIEIWFYDITNGQVLLKKKASESKSESNSKSAYESLAKARELYDAGLDDGALPELRRVLVLEPMNAGAYLLIGRIHLRRGNQEAAVSVLKTAIFWDAKLIDAHILLGRIFLERGDRGEAQKYANNALNIDPNNQEALTLRGQINMSNR
jgi:hypothetical protein